MDKETDMGKLKVAFLQLCEST